MLDDKTISMLQRHWEEGWNACDLDKIMQPMSADVVFSSPFVSRLTGDPGKTVIYGHAAVRSYMEDSLRRVPGVTYALRDTYVSPDSVILTYTFRMQDGTEKTGADIMKLRHGKIVEWTSHYPFSASELSAFIAE